MDKLQFVYVADVIPVAWLEAHKMEYNKDFGFVPVSVGQVLKMWQKERRVKSETEHQDRDPI